MELLLDHVQSSHKLLSIVAINEDIKAVMRISSEIDLAAINAMLIANKIGKTGSGFAVVSGELRSFSRRLNEAMHTLWTLVSELVREVAGVIRLNKTLNTLKMIQSNTTNERHLDSVLQHKSDQLREYEISLLKRHDNLVVALERAIKLCVMGQSLSNSAKIEAVYGEIQAGSLRQVSEIVEHAIGSILLTLNKLEKQLDTTT